MTTKPTVAPPFNTIPLYELKDCFPTHQRSHNLYLGEDDRESLDLALCLNQPVFCKRQEKVVQVQLEFQFLPLNRLATEIWESIDTSYSITK